MIRSVNIDGEDYLIRSCYKCPFYDNGDDSWGRHCQYPVNPSMKVEANDFQPYMDEIADDCPLGMVNEIKKVSE